MELEPDLLEYSQVVFDASPSWGKSGVEAAFQVICRIAPLLSKLNNDDFLWHFCQTVLYLRGVFLSEDTTRKGELIAMIRHDRGKEIIRCLEAWYEATSSFNGSESSHSKLITQPFALQ
ncbi:MAG: hypothetical protein H7Z17_15095 [Fuerstia sp.]|nr:hypothetical protein [Fuerstiella sp.]